MISGIGASQVSAVAGHLFRPRIEGPATGSRLDDAAHTNEKTSGSPDGLSEPASARRVHPASESKKADNAPGQDLTQEQERQVRQMKQRDRDVRAHEAAHATAGGAYAGSASFEYTVGPDGKRYATSGEVQIDASSEPGNPQATIRKLETVIRAATAPSDPSSQDLQVARQAQQGLLKARAELREQKEEERGQTGEETASSGGGGLQDAPAANRSLQSVILQAHDAYSKTAGQARREAAESTGS